MMRQTKASNKSKSQVVFFRVSNEDYERMQKASQDAGLSSLSSFTRFAVLFWLESHTMSDGAVKDEIHSLRAKLMDFEVAFDQFVRNRLQSEEGDTAEASGSNQLND
jgi:hypothetical protein